MKQHKRIQKVLQKTLLQTQYDLFTHIHETNSDAAATKADSTADTSDSWTLLQNLVRNLKSGLQSIGVK